MSVIKLRALTIADCDKTLAWNNQKEISDLYSAHPFPVNIEMEKKWYDKILLSNFPTTVFGIEELENNELIGITVLKDINLIHRKAEFSIYIGDNKYKGKGLAYEAMEQTLIFGFHSLGLNRIFLKVTESNLTAIKLYQKAGFQIEGLLKESIFKNNQFTNELIMGILKCNFDEKS